jgi:penicillin amidase
VPRLGGIAKRLGWIALIVVVVLIAGLTTLVGAITLRALPQTTGSLTVAGLDKSVRIDRDASGIAWIVADTPHDLFLAQGYLHAQERMWQMEVWRHISAGRLSELFGTSTLDDDRFIRTLGWRKAAARDLEALSPDAHAAVDAYAEGVNAWLADHKGNLGLPFVVTGLKAGIGGLGGYDPEPWTALDTMAWQKVQAWQLGGNFDTEIFRMLADAKLGDPVRTDELFPAYGADMPVITPSGLNGSGGAGAAAAGGASEATGSAGTRARADGRSPVATAASAAGATPTGVPAAWRDVAALGNRILKLAGLDGGEGIAGDHQVGSNDWVVGPSKSATKAALLANDPHLGIAMPSVWFMNGLRCRSVGKACPFDVAGVSFPGVPGVILGHNARISWGATNVDPDVEDLFSIEPDPSNELAYIHGKDSLPFLIHHETIKVAGGGPVDLVVRETIDGPIVNGVDDRLEDAPLLALRWTGTDDVDGAFESLFHVNTASDFEEFHAAFEGYGSPSQNFVYADVDGHIGYVLPGRIPIRADPADRGARIRSGSDGRHDWVGTIPFEDLPWQLDPPSGLIVSANNAAVDAKYPYFVADEWDPGYRAKRITQLLEAAVADGGVTIRDIRAIQSDTTVVRAVEVVPFVGNARPATEDGKVLLARILDWHAFDCPTESVGCAAYLGFEYRLIRGLFDDELGPLAREYVGGGASWQAMIALLSRPDSPWWDDTRTADRHETREDVIAAALDETGRELRAAYGDKDRWTWGALHTATFREATLGSSGIGPLDWYLDKGPYAVPGAAGAINNTYYRPSRAYADPDDPTYVPVGIGRLFEVTNLPSYRLAIDLADPDGARIVQTTGQSGNPFDTHYGDLIDDWIHGDSVPLPFTPAAVKDASIQVLELLPKAIPR